MNKTKKTAAVTDTPKDHKKQVSGQIESALNRNKELEDMLKRTLADYQNLERRIEEERRMLSKLSSLLLIEKLLPVLDNLENAQAHIKDEGLEMVIKQFKEVLASEGVTEIQAEGQKFDPTLHEATDVTEGPDEGRIVKVVNKGYMVENKVIRPAKVIVIRKSAHQQDQANQPIEEEQAPDLGGI